MLVERLQPQRRDKKWEVSKGQMEGWIPEGAAFALWSQHPTSPGWGITKKKTTNKHPGKRRPHYCARHLSRLLLLQTAFYLPFYNKPLISFSKLVFYSCFVLTYCWWVIVLYPLSNVSNVCLDRPVFAKLNTVSESVSVCRPQMSNTRFHQVKSLYSGRQNSLETTAIDYWHI